MNKLIIGAALCAATLAATADTNAVAEVDAPDYAPIQIRVNGTNRIIRARRLLPDFSALEKAHGKRVGIEKDSLTGEITWVYADGFKVSRKLPKALANNAALFANINKAKIERFEARKQERSAQ